MVTTTVQIERQERERNSLERRGVQASRRIMQSIQTGAIDAVINGIDPAAVVQSRVNLLIPTFRDALVASHLRGYRRSQIAAESAMRTAERRGRGVKRTLAMAAGVYTEVINYLRERSAMTDVQINALRVQYGSVAMALSQQVVPEIERSLQRTLLKVRGEGIITRDGLRRFEAAMRRNGVTGTRSSLVETMFRTQTAIGYSVGRQRANETPEIDDILWGYQYFSVGDDRVRPTHLAMDGTKAPKDDPIWQTWMPPAGWNCRCTTTEIYNTDDSRDRTRKPPPPAIVVDDEVVPVVPDKGFAVNFASIF